MTSWVLQYLVWLLALTDLVLGLYGLALNHHASANRHISFLFLLLSLISFCSGFLVAIPSVQHAGVYTAVLAAIIPALQPAILLAAIVLLRPDMLRPETSRYSWIRWGLRLLIFYPTFLVLTDIASKTVLLGAASANAANRLALFYTGLDPLVYQGGYAILSSYTGGVFKGMVETLNMTLPMLASFAFLLYEGTRGLSADPLTLSSSHFRRRGISWALLLALLAGAIIRASSITAANLAMSTVAYLLITLVFGYAIFGLPGLSQTDTNIPQTRQRPALHRQMIAALLAVALPLLLAMAIFLTDQARRQLEQAADQRLADVSSSMGNAVSVWLETYTSVLQNLGRQPAILSLQPEGQNPVLAGFAATYPNIIVISTAGLDGKNIARSDGQAARDYHNLAWFEQAAGLAGPARPAFAATASRDIWKPDLIIAVPVYAADDTSTPVQIAILLSSLDELDKKFQETRLGEQGFALLVDEQNRLIAHPEWATAGGLSSRTRFALDDFSDYPPIKRLREGQSGLAAFQDEDGRQWRSYTQELENGWGLVVQQPEDELLIPIQNFQRIAALILLIAFIILAPLTWIVLRRGLQPVRVLTDVALAVAGGNMEKQAPVDSEDELGILAKTFNTMTGQLRELISGLEQRVAERTQIVQRRALQLQVTAEVAREAAAIRDPEQLLTRVTQLIAERFSFDHAGIFLLDTLERQAGTGMEPGEASGYAILRAASSEGGRKMLARHHRLKVGTGAGRGIVGTVAATGLPRIALDVGSDAAFFNNPDLPNTHSEMALPLKIRQQVIGVLDVQSNQEAAFTKEDVDTLQILADQVAVAIENTRLLSASEQTLTQLEAIYGQQMRQNWQTRLKGAAMAYTFDGFSASRGFARGKTSEPAPNVAQKHVIEMPIELRNQRLGKLVLKRSMAWTQAEVELLEDSVNQVALALENARLLEDIQQRAFQEEMVGQMMQRIQASMDFESVLKTAVQEIGQTIDLERVQIRLIADHTEAAAAPPIPGPDADNADSDTDAEHKEGAQ